MRLRNLVVVALVGILSCAVNIAAAQDAVAPATNIVALEGVSFAEAGLENPRLRLDITPAGEARFASLAPAPARERARRGAGYEFAFTASGAAGFDVSLAQRAGFGFDHAGDIDRRSRGSELRLGRGLKGLRDDAPSSAPSWYFFAASEDEALVWRPGQRTAFGASSPGFALQDRVEIGDLQAGITYEVAGMQASLAYVEREISVHTGSRSISQDERFAGFTLTMRR